MSWNRVPQRMQAVDLETAAYRDSPPIYSSLSAMLTAEYERFGDDL